MKPAVVSCPTGIMVWTRGTPISPVENFINCGVIVLFELLNETQQAGINSSLKEYIVLHDSKVLFLWTRKKVFDEL